MLFRDDLDKQDIKKLKEVLSAYCRKSKQKLPSSITGQTNRKPRPRLITLSAISSGTTFPKSMKKSVYQRIDKRFMSMFIRGIRVWRKNSLYYNKQNNVKADKCNTDSC